MIITKRAFEVAMETYGAKRMPDIRSPKTHLNVPAFKVGKFEFLHSGSGYIIGRGNKIPQEIIEHAKEECENIFSKDGNVCSVEGILTLVTMLEGRYSKRLVDEVINETYKKLLEEMDIHTNPEFPFYNTDSPKMEELCKLLTEYSKVVNPFESGKKLKDPIDYLNFIECMSSEDHTRLCLSTETESVCTLFIKDQSGWLYHGKCYNEKSHNKARIVIEHNYNDGTDKNFPLDEVVLLSYEANEETQDEQSNEFVLEISLKTGLAWENYVEENGKPVTNEQIEMVIDCLKIGIEKIRQNIVDYMVSDN